MINKKAVLWVILLSHSHHQHVFHNQVKGPLVIFFWSWILETALCCKSCWKEEMTAWVLGCIYILTGIYCSDLFARNAQTLPFSSQLSSPWKSKLARIHHFFFFSQVPIKNIPIVRIIWKGKNNSIQAISALPRMRKLEISLILTQMHNTFQYNEKWLHQKYIITSLNILHVEAVFDIQIGFFVILRRS